MAEDQDKAAKRSPLYTSALAAHNKRTLDRQYGRDADGAHRVFGRIDRKDSPQHHKREAKR